MEALQAYTCYRHAYLGYTPCYGRSYILPYGSSVMAARLRQLPYAPLVWKYTRNARQTLLGLVALGGSCGTVWRPGLRYHTCLLSSTYQLMTNSPTYLPPSQPLVLPPPNVNINVTTLQAALAESLEREQQARGTRLLKG